MMSNVEYPNAVLSVGLINGLYKSLTKWNAHPSKQQMGIVTYWANLGPTNASPFRASEFIYVGGLEA